MLTPVVAAWWTGPVGILLRLPGMVGAGAAGAVLGAAALVAAHVRRTKPLHPDGRAGRGTLHVDPEGGSGGSGVPLLDQPGDHDVQVRWSRGGGLPSWAPDVEGLAIRLLDHGPADVLLAGSGTGIVGRHVLHPRTRRRHGEMSTLFPYRTAGGSLVLMVSPGDVDGDLPGSWELSWSRVGGPWHRVGRLSVTFSDGDEITRYDPVTHQLPGASQSPAVVAIREPAYAAARTVRARLRPV